MYECNQDLDDIYKILHINKKSTIHEIRKSYKKLILKYHPDKNIGKDTSEQFIRIQNAYKLLESIYEKTESQQNIPIFSDLQYNNNLFLIIINFFKNNSSTTLVNKISNELYSVFKNNDIMKIIKLVKSYNTKLTNLSKIKSFLDIEVTINVSIKDYYNNIPFFLSYDRITKNKFEEYIYPIDLEQIYELEGEIIKTDNNNYEGNVIVKNKIEDTFIYNNLTYSILHNDLYVFYKETATVNNSIEITLLNDIKYEFSITSNSTEEYVYNNNIKILKVCNMGLPYYDTNKNIIDTSNCSVKRGNLFIYY
jgi:DnaJ-class molecular chaperone